MGNGVEVIRQQLTSSQGVGYLWNGDEIEQIQSTLVLETLLYMHFYYYNLVMHKTGTENEKLLQNNQPICKSIKYVDPRIITTLWCLIKSVCVELTVVDVGVPL